jgi:hypothetical protein
MDGIVDFLKAILFVVLLIWLVYGLLKWQALIHRRKQGREACIPTGIGQPRLTIPPNESVMKPVSKVLAFLTNGPGAALPLPDKRREITYMHECPVCGKGHRGNQARHAKAYGRKLACSIECESQRRGGKNYGSR